MSSRGLLQLRILLAILLKAFILTTSPHFLQYHLLLSSQYSLDYRIFRLSQWQPSTPRKSEPLTSQTTLTTFAINVDVSGLLWTRWISLWIIGFGQRIGGNSLPDAQVLQNVASRFRKMEETGISMDWLDTNGSQELATNRNLRALIIMSLASPATDHIQASCWLWASWTPCRRELFRSMVTRLTIVWVRYVQWLETNFHVNTQRVQRSRCVSHNWVREKLIQLRPWTFAAEKALERLPTVQLSIDYRRENVTMVYHDYIGLWNLNTKSPVDTNEGKTCTMVMVLWTAREVEGIDPSAAWYSITTYMAFPITISLPSCRLPFYFSTHHRQSIFPRGRPIKTQSSQPTRYIILNSHSD